MRKIKGVGILTGFPMIIAGLIFNIIGFVLTNIYVLKVTKSAYTPFFDGTQIESIRTLVIIGIVFFYIGLIALVFGIISQAQKSYHKEVGETLVDNVNELMDKIK